MTDIDYDAIALEVKDAMRNYPIASEEDSAKWKSDYLRNFIARVDEERAKLNPAVAWLYDWDSDEGQVKNWFAHDYQEVIDQDGYNVRPLFPYPPAPQVKVPERPETISEYTWNEWMRGYCAVMNHAAPEYKE